MKAMNLLPVSGRLRPHSCHRQTLPARTPLLPLEGSGAYFKGARGLPAVIPEEALEPAPAAEVERFWRERAGAGDLSFIATPDSNHGLPVCLKNALAGAAFLLATSTVCQGGSRRPNVPRT